MKQTLLILIQLGVFLIAHGQSLPRSVIPSSGNFDTNAHVQLTWTLGEPVSETISNTNAVLTQGFIQTSLLVSSIQGSVVDLLEAHVYPVPAAQNVCIDLDKDPVDGIQASLWSLNGQQVSSWEINSQRTTLDLSPLVSGTYFLHLRSKDDQSVQIFNLQILK